MSEVQVKFYEQIDDEKLKFAVIISKTGGKWGLCKHKERNTYEVPGGHREPGETILQTAKRELQEETGVKNARLVSEDIFSLEVLPVSGHEKKGKYVPSHLHLNITYLAEANENEDLTVNVDENKGVKWFAFDEALQASKEEWFVDRIYKKLIKKVRELDNGAK